MELNCDNCKYGEAEYMGDEPCLSCGKHFDRWVKTEKPINSGYPLLADVGERLLPCPFCGGEGREDEGKDTDGEEFFLIHCKCCASEGGWGRSKRTALMFWNKRANVS